jgi:hypothetical protein
MSVLGIIFIWMITAWAFLDFTEGYKNYKLKKEKLCIEMNCCYDKEFDAVNCKDWKKQLGL